MSRRIARIAAASALLAAVAGASACGGSGSRPASTALAEMEQARTAPGAQVGAQLAPQEFAHAEQERDLARRAQQAGDQAAAELHAERATAAYGHALVLARAARAEHDLEGATGRRDDANQQLAKLLAARTDIEQEADSLEKQVKIAREMLLPAPSGPTDPQRDAARRVAAKALATQAHLLCGAARLVFPTLDGLSDADAKLADLDSKMDDATKPAPIDPAARARAGCLDLLTLARRSLQSSPDAGAGSTGDADALLSELSASGGWDPTRDERGVVVVLRDVFTGTSIAPAADAKLKELGKVSAAHPGFAIQVVVHDASPPSAADAAADTQRANAVLQDLVGAGAAASSKAETAGARAPLLDPGDAKDRARNARVEIVFVAPTS